MRSSYLEWRSFVYGACLTLCGCAQMPDSMAALQWTDAWGDRGWQVMHRDYAMCVELVEQHRSQLSGCMASRGWQIR
jgi:hypothetical protein